METPDHPTPLELSLRDKLAIDRTRLANERTLLAFIRTGLYFCVMGLTVIKLEAFEAMAWTSLPLFLISGVFITIGTITYVRNRQKIRQLYRDDFV